MVLPLRILVNIYIYFLNIKNIIISKLKMLYHHKIILIIFQFPSHPASLAIIHQKALPFITQFNL